MAGKALILGNGELKGKHDPEDYDFVAMFNNPTHKAMFRHCNRHFCRCDQPSGRHYGGEELIGSDGYSAMPVFIDGVEGQQSLEKRYPGVSMRHIRSRQLADTRRGYIISSGLVAIRYFLSYKTAVVIDGFDFTGHPVHDWEGERKQIEKLVADGIITMVGKPSALKAAECIGHDPLDPPAQPFTGERRAHFFWLSHEPETRDFNIREFVSIFTFSAHHRDWKITLWTNCTFKGPFATALKRRISTGAIDRVPDQLNLSAEVDYWKWVVLRDHGGMVLDISDTLTLASFDDIHDGADKLRWTYYSITCCQMGNGWMVVNRPGADIAGNILGVMTAPGHRNNLGEWERTSLMQVKLSNDVSPLPVKPEVVLGGGFSWMWDCIQRNRMVIPSGCLQLHLCYGNVLQDAMHLKKKAIIDGYYADLKNWKSGKNIITRAFRRSMKSAGVKRVPALEKIKR